MPELPAECYSPFGEETHYQSSGPDLSHLHHYVGASKTPGPLPGQPPQFRNAGEFFRDVAPATHIDRQDNRKSRRSNGPRATANRRPDGWCNVWRVHNILQETRELPQGTRRRYTSLGAGIQPPRWLASQCDARSFDCDAGCKRPTGLHGNIIRSRREALVLKAGFAPVTAFNLTAFAAPGAVSSNNSNWAEATPIATLREAKTPSHNRQLFLL